MMGVEKSSPVAGEWVMRKMGKWKMEKRTNGTIPTRPTITTVTVG